MAATATVDDAKKALDLVIGPDELVAKVPELKFESVDALLKQNGLTTLPPPPKKELCQKAKEQQKTLIFRVQKDGTGKPVTLGLLKERFGGLIYSTWHLKPPAPFASEELAVGWALVDLDPLPSSTDRTFDEQQAYTKEQGVRLKSPVADVYDLLVAYKVTGKFSRGGPINARTGAVHNGDPVKISHFDKSGMCISTGWGKSVKHADIGAATELIIS
jgi:hypothetical protein